jgi:hypothetical protein
MFNVQIIDYPEKIPETNTQAYYVSQLMGMKKVL